MALLMTFHSPVHDWEIREIIKMAPPKIKIVEDVDYSGRL